MSSRAKVTKKVWEVKLENEDKYNSVLVETDTWDTAGRLALAYAKENTTDFDPDDGGEYYITSVAIEKWKQHIVRESDYLGTPTKTESVVLLDKLGEDEG